MFVVDGFAYEPFEYKKKMPGMQIRQSSRPGCFQAAILWVEFQKKKEKVSN